MTAKIGEKFNYRSELYDFDFTILGLFKNSYKIVVDPTLKEYISFFMLNKTELRKCKRIKSEK